MALRHFIAPVIVLSILSTLGGCSPNDDGAPVDSLEDQTSQNLSTPFNTEIPEGIAQGSNEAIAWEALMGPDGEYAAAASYQAVLDQFGPVEPYATIKESEERHIDALTRQLNRYNITVPANPYLGIVEAPEDLETAAQEWALGEILNVDMYDQLMEQATDDRLVRVLENLRRASLEEHLPAFEAAAANGGTLDPGTMSSESGRN